MNEPAAQAYSPAFDLAWRSEPPRVHYIIATLPRTGSTFLAHELWRTGALGVPLEYLNFRSDGQYPDAAGNPAAQIRHWHHTRATRTTVNGVFGHKVFLKFLSDLKQDNPKLLDLIRPNRIVYLTRSDRLAHMTSYARAVQSGAWTADAAPRRSSAYERPLLDRAQDWIERQEEGWEWLFRALGVEPLRICYEETVADTRRIVEQVAAHVGVELREEYHDHIPALRRQADVESADWMRRYRTGN